MQLQSNCENSLSSSVSKTAGKGLRSQESPKTHPGQETKITSSAQTHLAAERRESELMPDGTDALKGGVWTSSTSEPRTLALCSIFNFNSCACRCALAASCNYFYEVL